MIRFGLAATYGSVDESMEQNKGEQSSLSQVVNISSRGMC